MVIDELKLPGLRRIVAEVHGDERGFFMEAFNREVLRTVGIDFEIVQHNQSRSQSGVVRGIHFQWDKPLSKLIRVIRGKAYVVAVDLRPNSPTYCKWIGMDLSEHTRESVFLPFGFGSGFFAYEDDTELEYYYSTQYNPGGESNVRWNDPDLGIVWPTSTPILSDRDRHAQTLSAWEKRPESQLFAVYRPEEEEERAA